MTSDFKIGKMRELSHLLETNATKVVKAPIAVLVLFLFLCMPDVSASTAVDACEAVNRLAAKLNSGLPNRADSKTIVEVVEAECIDQSITIVKLLEFSEKKLEESNPLWKIELSSDWSSEVCGEQASLMLSKQGWEWRQSVKLLDGSIHMFTSSCENPQSTANNEQEERMRYPAITEQKASLCYNMGLGLDNGSWEGYRSQIDAYHGGYANDPECVAIVMSVASNASLCRAISVNVWSTAITRDYHFAEAAKRNLQCSSSSSPNSKQLCLSRCLMTNSAGSGISGIVPGLNDCAQRCR